jgi:hypothetical protein
VLSAILHARRLEQGGQGVRQQAGEGGHARAHVGGLLLRGRRLAKGLDQGLGELHLHLAHLNHELAAEESLCKLPMCVGALYGTFMRITKPKVWGDAFFCYKKYCAILVLACVDARGRFTYVSAGEPGSVGDAAAWNRSSLKRKCEQLLAMPADVPPRVLGGMHVKP